MDIISWLLARKYCDNSIRGISGALSGKNCTIYSATKSGNITTVIFKWTADDGTTRTTQIEVKDGETPAFSSVSITGGHRLTFTTQDPTQSVSFDVMDGAKGDTGVSVVASNVDENNNLTLTLSNGNIINAGKIKAVTTVDNALSTTSSNPVENKVITNALNNKVDKEMGKGLFSDEEKTKLANIEDGAQVNVLEKLIVNGQEATITDKAIALTIITSAVSNLQNYYLKSETYTKQEVEDLIGSTVGVTIEIVEQLPTEGQSNVIYFLPTETEGVYSQYIYTTDGWILIGSTTVDLSNYYTKAQVDTLLNGKQNVLTIDSFPTPLSNNPVASGGVYTAIAQMQPQFQFANMPTASSSNLGFVYQYTGATGTYTQNMFYRCVYDDVLGEYKWEEVIFHATVTVDSAISGISTNPVQNKVIKEALDTKQDIMQYSTMPSAQDNLGKIVQYIGTNTANYTNGYFYKAVYNSESDVYLWTVIKFSADMLVDNALSTTSENPVQNKVITGAINDIQDVIPSDASSTNQLVDRNSLGTASQKNFTPYVSPNDGGVPISSSVYSAITSAVYGAYHPSGSKTIAELTSDLLVLANVGNVYKITEDGVTTDLFIGGAGQTIHTGDNAVVVYGGQTADTFLFDLQSGSIDLTPYQTKALTNAVESETTVEGALGALSTNKASKVSNATAGDIATLDVNGNLVDSGISKNGFVRTGVITTSSGDGYKKVVLSFESYLNGRFYFKDRRGNEYVIMLNSASPTIFYRLAQVGGTREYIVEVRYTRVGTNEFDVFIHSYDFDAIGYTFIGGNNVNIAVSDSDSTEFETGTAITWKKFVTDEIIPSNASASNKLLSYKSTQLYANYQSDNTRVVRIEYPSNLATRLHLITEPGSALRDVFIQLVTRTPFVAVYDMGASSLFTVKTADISNKRVVYINVRTSDGSVIINQDDVPTDGYGNLLLPTVTVTNTSDEEWTSATAITPQKLVTKSEIAPLTCSQKSSGSSWTITSEMFTSALISLVRDGDNYSALGWMTWIFNTNIKITWLVALPSGFTVTNPTKNSITITNNTGQNVTLSVLNMGQTSMTIE